MKCGLQATFSHPIFKVPVCVSVVDHLIRGFSQELSDAQTSEGLGECENDDQLEMEDSNVKDRLGNEISARGTPWVTNVGKSKEIVKTHISFPQRVP